MIGDENDPQMHIGFIHTQSDGTGIKLTEIISWDEFYNLPSGLFTIQPTSEEELTAFRTQPGVGNEPSPKPENIGFAL